MSKTTPAAYRRPNGHGNDATPDDKITCHARFPHPAPLPEGEGANESLREFHAKHLSNSTLSPLPRVIDVRSLLGNDPFVMIKHGDCRYVLRMTRNNKLILTK
ncbi:MAG: hemin uptake protein HemP [Thermochromatium sp.]